MSNLTVGRRVALADDHAFGGPRLATEVSALPQAF